MASEKQAILAAIAKYGPSVDHIAARYTNPVTGQKLSGRALLAKLLEGESSALSNPEGARSAVSSAGAKAWGQFMPGSRQEAISKFGVDPWRSADEAVHATSLHLRGKINGSTGLEGYNPGDPNYPAYILSRKVGHLAGKALAPSGSSARATVGGAPLPERAAAQQAPSGLTDVMPLAAALQLKARPQGPAMGGLPAPAFAAGPQLAGNGLALPQSGGPAPAPELELPDATQAQLPSAMMPVNQETEDGAPSMARVEAREARGEPGELPPLHPGGMYEGTQGLARHARYRAEKEGWTVSSAKRDRRSTATGGVSDHWAGKKNAWAYDFGNGTATANDGGRKLARDIAARYGVKFVENSYDSGGTIKVGDHRFRLQILYGNDIDHGDHVHVGFERVS